MWWEQELQRVEIKITCLDRLSSEVFEVFCSDSEVKGAGDSWGSSACVLVLPPVVPDVTVSFSDVNVAGGFVWFGL